MEDVLWAISALIFLGLAAGLIAIWSMTTLGSPVDDDEAVSSGPPQVE